MEPDDKRTRLGVAVVVPEGESSELPEPTSQPAGGLPAESPLLAPTSGPQAGPGLPAESLVSAPTSQPLSRHGFPVEPQEPAPTSQPHSGHGFPVEPQAPAPTSQPHSGHGFPVEPQAPAPTSQPLSRHGFPVEPQEPAPSQPHSGHGFPVEPQAPAPTSQPHSGHGFPVEPQEPAPTSQPHSYGNAVAQVDASVPAMAGAEPSGGHLAESGAVQQSGPTANPGTAELETLSGRFIWISLWRAFRLQIHTSEVLASERRILTEDAQHIVDPEHQAFLAWRRSVLLVVAICFVPLTLVRLVEAFQGPPMPVYARIFVLFPAIAEGLFCAIAFDQLRNWTKWKKQRRVLFIAWAIYMLAPFIVYLYPFRTIYEDSLIRTARQAAEIGGMRLAIKKDTMELVVGLAFGVKALLVLGPKVISLMPGLIRAAIVSKLLFPGMTAPGWLMMLAAPLYALFAYIIILLPYQITGSWLFVAGNAGLLFAQIFIALAGRRLTEPLDLEEARRRIQRSWKAYMGIMMVSAGFMIFGLHDFITQLHLSNLRIVSSVLAFVSGVLLLTLIGTDGIVGGMAHFRKKAVPNPERELLLKKSEDKLNRFSN